MKRSFIIGLILIGVAIAVLVSASKDITSYASFKDARSTGRLVKIVGQLAKEKDMVYDPVKDPNHFSFYVTDKSGETLKVILNAAKPQDFELSEQIVVTGKMQDGVFMAKDVLLKCPSKYKDEEVYIKSES
ncbi:MAG: cytochrome c maturation protein CcmE [Saprospiraceae bacterium]|nr:cytochrome c maturation protein CcmE [Candidatus Vicinibacter affinis]MBP6174009.1 cytochrome c maturation protein CcmE [Saprospiraceae bacterium]MBK6572593.1 cytochrome c maturation protein CcmE [Candidatus Vicinibacter affinis]MBK6824327.1 cytochrome c maturation protein CcmE [Candidatus Vicinibacter affinis]MBK7303051.1 cytochrome c maturation protein CcmE [Candidatus Vicinibacter affinis]